MKSFIVLLLISYIFTAEPPTGVTLDLKASQTLATTDKDVILTVTAAGNPMTLSALTNLVLQSGTSTTIALTCTFATPVSCTANTPTDVTCTVASLTAGTYQLAVADSQTLSMTATYNDGENDVAVPNTVVPAVNKPPTSITVSAPIVNNDPPTGVTLDLKASQTLATTDKDVILTVTAAGNTMTLSALTNLVLQSGTSTTIALTCTFATPVSCTANTPTDVTCTVASLTAGTYQLAVADSQTLSMTATYNDGENDVAVPNTVVPAVNNPPTSITVSAPIVNNDPPTSVTLDLKASQTLTVGTEGSVIIKVTADKAMSLSALTNLVLQSTETASTTIALTCSFTPAVSCTANTAKEATCKVVAPTTAGTYNLAAASGKSISMTANYGNNAQVSGVTPTVAAKPTSLTVSTASNNDNTNPDNSNDSENDDDNSSFLKFSYIMCFIVFLF